MKDILFVDEHSGIAGMVRRCMVHTIAGGVDTARTSKEKSIYYSPEVAGVLIPSPLVDLDFIERCKCPVILLDRIDGAQLGRAREWIDHPNVAAVVKMSTFVDPENNNRGTGRWHVNHLMGLDITPPGLDAPRIEHLDKIKVWAGFCGFEWSDSIAATNVDLTAPRPYSLHFAGTVDYGGKNGSQVTAHRQAAYDAAIGLARNGPQRVIALRGPGLAPQTHRRTMLQSKAVLCPWGLGEDTHRFWEALLAGCIPIAPDSSHVRTKPDAYRTHDGEGLWVQYRCKPDFSDVPELVERVEKNWVGSTCARGAIMNWIRGARSPEIVGGRLGKILREAVK